MFSNSINWNLPFSDWLLLGLLGFLLLAELFSRGLRFFRVVRAARHRAEGKDADSNRGYLPGVSIVICAREQRNLLDYLPDFLNQKYGGEFDVIVVDDTSDELFSAKLERFRQQQTPGKLYITRVNATLEGTLPPRKLSLSIGFKASEREWIVMAQSDSHPVGDRWLENLMRSGGAHQDLILGPTLRHGGSHRLAPFHRLMERTCSLYRSVERAGYARSSGIYLGYRGNLAFRRELFFAGAGAYAGFNHLRGGDDDLFTLRIGRRGRVGVALSSESMMLQDSSMNWHSFWLSYLLQRESIPFYPRGVRIRLGWDMGLRMVLFAVALLLFILFYSSPVVLISVPCVLLLRFLTLHLGMESLRKRWKIRALWATDWSYDLRMDLAYDFLWPFMTFAAMVSTLGAPTQKFGLRNVREPLVQSERV